MTHNRFDDEHDVITPFLRFCKTNGLGESISSEVMNLPAEYFNLGLVDSNALNSGNRTCVSEPVTEESSILGEWTLSPKKIAKE